MIIPYNIATYKRSALPRVRLVNLYAEKTPSSRTQTSLMARPALQAHAEVGTGPIRGMFAQPGALGNELFVVSAETLYAGSDDIGEITGTDRVSMASSTTQLLIANDTGLFLSDGASVTPVTFPDDAGVSSVAYINGYFLAARAGTQRFYWSTILDGAAWDPLDYASAERSPDVIVALWVVSDQVWIFGEVTTEVWVPTGDGELPFQRVEGRLYDQGCLARDTIARLDNTVFWVGHDFKVYRGDSTPLRVSDHGIEQMVQESDPADLAAWSFPWMGNLFYVLTTSTGTVAYNAATQQWSEFASLNRTTWRAHLGVFRDQQVIAGDIETGELWRLTDEHRFDGTERIEYRWTALMGEAAYADNLLIDAASGQSDDLDADMLCELRISRDGGNTFGNWRQASIGRQGAYRTRIAWRRLGMIDGDGALFDFRMTDPQLWYVASIRINQGYGGRSR